MALPGFASTEFIQIPLRIDDALDMTSEEYNAYLKDQNTELLKIKPGMTPVYFKMRKTLPYNQYLKIENMKMELVKKKDGDKVTQEMMPMMAWIVEEVRFSLVDIINPSDASDDEKVEFKRDSDGACSPEIMSWLVQAGVYMDLWSVRQPKKKEVDKKK